MDLSEAETAAVREAEAMAAAVILGIAHVEFYRQPDGDLRANRALVSRLAKRISDWRPHIIYMPHPAEQHPDHRIAIRLLQRSLASVDFEEMPRVLAYEVWTPLQQLDEIVDITPYMRSEIKGHCGIQEPNSNHEFRGRGSGTRSLSWRDALLARRRIRRSVCRFEQESFAGRCRNNERAIPVRAR